MLKKKKGDKPTCIHKSFLKDFLDANGGMDMKNGRKDRYRMRKKLYRVVASLGWILNHQKANVINKTFTVSDHSAIIFKTLVKNEFLPRPFRFLGAWCRDPTSIYVIELAWCSNVQGNAALMLCKNLCIVARRLKFWNKH